MLRVAVVDDSESVLTMSVSEITNRLKVSGIDEKVEFSTFTDPVRFIDAVKSNEYDLVLLDYNMPKLNGIQVADRLIKLAPKTNFIFVVSKFDEKLQQFFQDHQVTAIMLKDELYFGNIARFIEMLFSRRKESITVERLATTVLALGMIIVIGAYALLN